MDALTQMFHHAAHAVGLDEPSPLLPEILISIALSFALQCLISYTYKRTYRGSDYSQDYVHSLIILGTVVTVVIQAVRGDTATAFGMFAAFSIVRFRHSVRHSRDIGFIFLAMAAGLGVGARHYMLAGTTTLVLCICIYLFSKADLFAAQRLSHYLRIRVTNDLNYDTIFESCFAEHLTRWDLISVESIQAGMMTELRFNVSLKDESKPGAFVARIQQLNGNNRVLMTTAAPSYDMGE